jgi:hypothetical protein
MSAARRAWQITSAVQKRRNHDPLLPSRKFFSSVLDPFSIHQVLWLERDPCEPITSGQTNAYTLVHRFRKGLNGSNTPGWSRVQEKTLMMCAKTFA